MHGRVLAPVDVDVRVWEIWQPARVVKVQVRQNDVPDRLWLMPQPAELAYRRQLCIVGDAEDRTEGAHHPRGRLIIVQAQPRIHQDETLVGFDEQARRTDVPAREPG